MSEVILSGNIIPLDLFHGEPHTIIYDPGKHIHNPITQLRPLGSLVHVCHEEQDLINQIQVSRNKQLFISLIFPDKNEHEVKDFLTKYSSIQEHAYALYLIFPNGLQYHERWINSPTMPKLQWSRSFTTQLIRDTLDVCKSACNQHITFYEQQRIQAEDDIEHNNIDGAESIAALFARKKKEFSLLLFHYLTPSIELDD